MSAEAPIIVVGSGIAGALFALHAAAHADVLAFARPNAAGSTPWAQGGIAAAIGDTDSPEQHLADTVAASGGLVVKSRARALVEAGPRQIRTLERLGVRFDREDGRIALGQEAAHSARRIAHVGGDSTGAGIARALGRRLASHARATLIKETVVAIDAADGRARGVWSEDENGTLAHRQARAVVLATGGLGAVFLRTTNPATALGDGIALAASVGAALADLEFVQFHPTALAVGDGGLPLVSEAVRGEGAVLRDARGRRFMVDLHPLAELAPRDVVARAIVRVAAFDGRDPTLDLSGLDPEHVRRRFPSVHAACAEHGLDLATDPIPVTPAAHYSVGGVLTDLTGRSTVRDLYAIGECAASGVHGANRLASNSLLEAAVMAERAADHLRRTDGGWPEPAVPRGQNAVDPQHSATRPAELARIREIAARHVGVERDGEGLRRARSALLDLAPGLARGVVLAIAGAALYREESRGAHWRRDRPEPSRQKAFRVAWVAGQPHHLPTVHRDTRMVAA